MENVLLYAIPAKQAQADCVKQVPVTQTPGLNGLIDNKIDLPAAVRTSIF